MKKLPHPIQPLYKDKQGVLRFKANEIVKFLLDDGPNDMNRLALIKQFSKEDREQFAQLIGYSLSGFGELSYVSDETYEKAAKQKSEDEKITEVERKLDKVNPIASKYLVNLYDMSTSVQVQWSVPKSMYDKIQKILEEGK